jgi:hypothetical protein
MSEKRKRGKTRSLSFWNDKGEKQKVFGRFFDAKTPIDFNLMLDNYLITTSEKGVPWNCLLARGCIRHKNEFPHKVITAYANGSAVYVQSTAVTRAGQLPTFIKYRHNFTRTLRKFDTFSRPRFLNHFGNEGIEVKFSPPRRGGPARNPNLNPRPRPRGQQLPLPGMEKVIRRGAYRRAVDAGLLFETRPV